MKDVLMPSLALAAAHAGDLDTLQAFVDLVSPPLRDKTNRWHTCSHGQNTPQGHTGQWGCILAQGLAGSGQGGSSFQSSVLLTCPCLALF